MKNTIIILTSVFLMLIGTLQAQENHQESNNYLVLSKNIKQLNPVLLTTTELAKSNDNQLGKFYVIICGKTVQDIPNNKDFVSLLETAKTKNIRVFACGISLKKFNIEESALPDQLEVTENGILFAFQLAKKGFITLTI